jgi:hypothetical protein
MRSIRGGDGGGDGSDLEALMQYEQMRTLLEQRPVGA